MFSLVIINNCRSIFETAAFERLKVRKEYIFLNEVLVTWTIYNTSRYKNYFDINFGNPYGINYIFLLVL